MSAFKDEADTLCVRLGATMGVDHLDLLARDIVESCLLNLEIRTWEAAAKEICFECEKPPIFANGFWGHGHEDARYSCKAPRFHDRAEALRKEGVK